jgi:hypothetical protein
MKPASMSALSTKALPVKLLRACAGQAGAYGADNALRIAS